MADIEALLKKLRALPSERLSQVEDFVDFLIAKTSRQAALDRLLTIARPWKRLVSRQCRWRRSTQR